MPYIERIKTKVKHAPVKYAVLAGSLASLVLTKDIDGVRNKIPEPLDIMDHVGNVSPSAQLGYASGLTVGILAAKRASKRFENVNMKSLRTKMALGGFVTGIVVNALVETKFGVSLSNWQDTTPDPIDLAYGVTAATLSAGLVPNIEQETELKYVPYESTPERSEDLTKVG